MAIRGLVLGAVLALILTTVGAWATPPLPAPAATTPPTAVVGGDYHSLVIGGDGRVYGTGYNEYGQITGDPQITLTRKNLTLLTGLPAGVRAVGAAAGFEHSLVIGDDGAVYGSGWNWLGMLTGPDLWKTTLTRLSGLPDGVRAVAVAGGDHHSLVVGDDRGVYGTGNNGWGQLTGSGDKSTLTLVNGPPAIAVAAGYQTSLLLGEDGLVYGTGRNDYGQLTGSGYYKTAFTLLTGLPDGVRAIAVASGHYHSLVLGDDGLVYGSGRNGDGQLTGTAPTKSTLTALTGLPAGVRATAVAAGTWHSLVVGDDGVVYGTGFNGYWQLTGTGAKSTLTPLTGLPAGVKAIGVGAGAHHSLVVGDDGVVYGTGNNLHGEITGTDNPKGALTRLSWPIINTVAPKITGTARVGQTLTARNGQWLPTPTTYSYRWYRNSVAIPGTAGHAKTYRVVTKDVGTRLKVKVTAKRTGCLSASKFSPSTARVTRRP